MNPIIEMAKQYADGRPFAFVQLSDCIGICIKNEPGYHPMRDMPDMNTRKLNTEMGLDDQAAGAIIVSTMKTTTPGKSTLVISQGDK